MKFTTKKEAVEFKESETRLMPGIKIRVFKSEYMDMTTFSMVECFCVVKM